MPIEPINPNNLKLGEYQVKSGRAQRESGEVVNLADAIVATDEDVLQLTVDLNFQLDRLYERANIVAGLGLWNAKFPITTAGVQARVGPSNLAGRTGITIANESSGPIQVARTNVAFGLGLIIFGGQTLQVALDPSVDTTYFLRSQFFDTTIYFLEDKGATD